MKVIKTFVRPECVDLVLEELSKLDVLHLTVGHVFAVGPGIDEAAGKMSVEFGHKVNKMARIELMCLDRNEGKITETILDAGCTGQPGDGVVVVSNVNRLMEIKKRSE